MTALQLAFSDLGHRRIRSICVMLGLAAGIALVITVAALLNSMSREISSQLTDYGPSLIVTADSGDITFSYGGISLNGVAVGSEPLTMEAANRLEALPNRNMIRQILPVITGRVTVNGREAFVSGSDIRQEFAMKPWLRLIDYLDRTKRMAVKAAQSSAAMGKDALELEREDPAKLVLEPYEVFLGADTAYDLALVPTNRFIIGGQEFVVKAVLEKNGTVQDQYIMMELNDAMEILGKPGRLTRIELAVDQNLGSEAELISQIQTALPNAGINYQSKARTDREAILEGLGSFGTAISGFVLLMSALAAGVAMTTQVTERTREIGLFRAVGLRRSFIRRIILLEGFILSTGAGLLGYLAGSLCAILVLPALTGQSGAVELRPELLALALGLSLILGAISSIYPAGRAAAMDPADALRRI